MSVGVGSRGVASRKVSTQPAPQPRRTLPTALVVVAQGVATVAALAGAGALAGLLWFHLWTPPSGTVQAGEWLTDETGLRADFAGTGLYVVIAAGAGLVVGALVAVLFDRWELVTLGCVVGGAVLAGWVMYHVGIHDSPPDPKILAATAADGTTLPGHLHLARRTPFVAFPTGALLGYAVLLLVVPKRGLRRRAGSPPEGVDRPDQTPTPGAFQGPYAG